MTIYKRVFLLVAGCLVGIGAFFLYDVLWGDLPGKAWTDVVRWLPLNGIYLFVLIVLTSVLRFMQLAPILLLNGFLVGTISVLEARPPYMDSWSDGITIVLIDLFIFAMVNVMATGLIALARKQ